MDAIEKTIVHAKACSHKERSGLSVTLITGNEHQR
jgi:hypothetical protein